MEWTGKVHPVLCCLGGIHAGGKHQHGQWKTGAIGPYSLFLTDKGRVGWGRAKVFPEDDRDCD